MQNMPGQFSGPVTAASAQRQQQATVVGVSSLGLGSPSALKGGSSSAPASQYLADLQLRAGTQAHQGGAAIPTAAPAARLPLHQHLAQDREHSFASEQPRDLVGRARQGGAAADAAGSL